MTDTLKADDQSLSWLEEDRLHEECGVFGIFGHPDAAALTALGLHALQHRGQEAAGIVSFDGHHFHTERRLGLVGDHFTSSQVIDRLKGDAAIGHVRYSTCGDPILRNVQPLFVDLDSGGFALAHNGNLTNALTMRDWLIKKGAICQSTTDTEVILHLVARSEKCLFVEKFIEALLQVEGAYALVGLTNTNGLYDPDLLPDRTQTSTIQSLIPFGIPSSASGITWYFTSTMPVTQRAVWANGIWVRQIRDSSTPSKRLTLCCVTGLVSRTGPRTVLT